jgi:hypothetical protein
VTFPEVGDYELRLYDKTFESDAERANSKPILTAPIKLSTTDFTEKNSVLSAPLVLQRGKIKSLESATIEVTPVSATYPKVEFVQKMSVSGAQKELDAYLSKIQAAEQAAQAKLKQQNQPLYDAYRGGYSLAEMYMNQGKTGEQAWTIVGLMSTNGSLSDQEEKYELMGARDYINGNPKKY